MELDITKCVQADLNRRADEGAKKYGTRLMQNTKAHNGKCSLSNAYEEALDLAVYLRQELALQGCTCLVDKP